MLAFDRPKEACHAQAAGVHGTRRTRGRGMKKEGNMVYALFSLGVAAAVAAIYTAAVGYLWFRQERLLFEPTRLPPDQKLVGDADVHEFTIEVPGASLSAAQLRMPNPRGV